MKSYLSLVPISARIHKRQSRMTRICIMLAVFLVTSIFSMAEMWIKSEQTAMIRKHGNYHVILQNMQTDEVEQIRRRADIAVSCEYGAINTNADQGYTINGKNVILYGVEETYPDDIMSYPAEGAYPQNDSDIALSADAKELFGIHTGDSITLSTPSGNIDFVVSAFYEDDTVQNEMIDGCCAYMNRSVFQTICDQNGESVNPKYYIRFAEGANLRKVIADIREQYGLSEENIDENTVILGLTGASSNKTAQNIYPVAIVCFLLVLISGILMISSCMNSNVAQRTSFFGMLRCIGASKEQIVRFVRLEALNWCKSAIPAGCLLGVTVCWVLCAVLRLVIKGDEWANMPLFGVSVSGVICGIAVGIITVFMAAHSPAKQAAKVSPIAAVSGNTEMSKTVRHAANARFFNIETALGIHHATAARKNLFLMTGSFAITIVLFLFFSACLDIVHKLLPSESNFSPDVAIVSCENANTIDRNLAARVSEIPGVKNVLCTMYDIALPVKVNGNETVIDLVSYDAYMLDSAKKSVASGDLSKVYGDSDYVFTIFSQDSRLDVGDRIEIGGKELEIACVASEGIGSVSGSPVIVCSEETFMRLTGAQGYMMINVLLEKGASETDINQIRDLAGNDLFEDRREDRKDVYSSYWVFRLAIYGFLAIISFITVLNIMNSVSMSVSARIRQYGAMRAVGMESRQLTRMIMAEAATYAFSGMIVGIITGLILHYVIYVKIIVTHFGGAWEIPFSTITVIVLLVSISCVAAVHAPAKRIREMAVTATINEL